MALIALLGGCSGAQRDFRKAERANTTEAYADFIAKHPDGVLARRARARMTDHAFARLQALRVANAVIAIIEPPPSAAAGGSKERACDHFSGSFVEACETNPTVQTTAAGETEERLLHLSRLIDEGGDPGLVRVVCVAASGWKPEILEGRHFLAAFRDTEAREGTLAYDATMVWSKTGVSWQSHKHPKTHALLRPFFRESAPIHVATLVRRGDISGVERFFSKGQSASELKRFAQGALLLAIRNGYPEIVEILMANGADPNEVDPRGATPLVTAAAANEVEIVRTLLARTATTGGAPYAREASTAKLSCQALLGKIALDDERETVRHSAAVHLADAKVLTEVANRSTDERIRDFAVGMLRIAHGSDDAKHMRALVFASDARLRREAATKLDDPTVMERLALRDTDPVIRQIALRKLSDQTVLLRAALGHSDMQTRAAAIDCLRDEAALLKLATEHTEPEVRLLAASRLCDSDALARIAATDQDRGVRNVIAGIVAASKLTNPAALAEVALADADIHTQRAAVAKLADDGCLAKVAFNAPSSLIRNLAIERLSDPALLESIALRHKDFMCRRAAVEKIASPAVLASVARDDKETWVRLAAIDKLDDHKLLTQIFDDPNADERVRFAALHRITDRKYLERFGNPIAGDLEPGKNRFERRRSARQRLGLLNVGEQVNRIIREQAKVRSECEDL